MLNCSSFFSKKILLFLETPKQQSRAPVVIHFLVIWFAKKNNDQSESVLKLNENLLTWAPILTRGHSRLSLSHNKIHRVKPDSQNTSSQKGWRCSKDRKINMKTHTSSFLFTSKMLPVIGILYSRNNLKKTENREGAFKCVTLCTLFPQ